jgi:biotin carboxyl carrier protein
MAVVFSSNAKQGLAGRRDLGFRAEAVAKSAGSLVGSTTLAVPLPFRWYSLAALSLIAMTIGFLALGSYTTTEVSQSVILTEGGLSSVKGSGNGVIAKLHVREGDRVQAGTPLADLRLESEEDGAVDDPGLVDPAVGEPGSESGISVVKSPTTGVVYQLPLSVGNAYMTFQDVAMIATEGDLAVTAQVSATAQSRLKIGDRIAMTLDAHKGSPRGRLMGRVSSVALSPTEVYSRQTGITARTYKVNITLDTNTSEHAQGALLGKTVSIKIPVQKRKMYQWLFDPLKTLFGDG